MATRPTPSASDLPIASTAAPAITNALVIGVEDHFQSEALAPYVSRSEWSSRDSRIERNVARILSLLAEQAAQASFFVLGWTAERYPQLVRDIAAGGHEVASQGYSGAAVGDEAAFLADVQLAKLLLEDLVGREVVGYQAPAASISGRPWLSDCLAQAGYRYHARARRSAGERARAEEGAAPAPIASELLEVPVSTLRCLCFGWSASGANLRLLPYSLSRAALQRFNREQGGPAVVHFHPWEIDTQQPQLAGPDTATRFRHYINIARMEGRLRRLLGDFSWGRVDRLFLAPETSEERSAA